MPHRGLWRSVFNHASNLGLRCSVVDQNGSLVAIHNWPGPGTDPVVLGHGWFEFLDPLDVRRLLIWFAEKADSGPITYRGPGPGGRIVTICLVKSRVGSCWLTVGEFSVDPAGSASPFGPSSADLGRRW